MTSRRTLKVAFVVLLVLGCRTLVTSPRTSEPGTFFVNVQNVDGPTAVVKINGSAVGTLTCGEHRGLTLQPNRDGVSDLPWSVTVVGVDGAQLAATDMDGSLSHTMTILHDGVMIDGPTPNPGVVPRYACPTG